MNRFRTIGLLLAAVLGAVPLFSQDPIEGPNVFGDLSHERMIPIFESRRLAYQELAPQFATFESPDIATALEFPSCLIVIARITAIQRPNGSSVPRTRISFRVEQVLRGISDVRDFDVESQWASPASDFTTLGEDNLRRTVLDKSGPKEGGRYILGYSPDNDDRELFFVLGAIDLQDPAQTGLIGGMKQFLAIEAAGADSGFGPYLEALDSSIPWIRNIAIHRLSESDACNTSPVCTQRFSTTIRRQLQSKIPNERLQASDWLVWIDSVSRSKSTQNKLSDGLAVLPDSAIRQLLSSAIDDRNVYIGDQAFKRREDFDYYRSAKPGACIQVVPALRKSAHWLPGKHDYSGTYELLPADFPLVSMTGCVPVENPKNR